MTRLGLMLVLLSLAFNATSIGISRALTMVSKFFSVVAQLRTLPKGCQYTLVRFFSAGGRDENPMLQTFETKEVLLPIAE